MAGGFYQVTELQVLTYLLNPLNTLFTIMPFNRNKTVSRVTGWTNKHDEFCLANNIPLAAKLLWEWLSRLGEAEETEPDLGEFNDWVKQHRSKGYCRPTLKNALAKLIDCGIVNLVRQYTWKIVKIVTRPLEWLTPKKKLTRTTTNLRFTTLKRWWFWDTD